MKSSKLIQLLILYINRYLRLVPLMIISILITVYYLPILSDGPTSFSLKSSKKL